MNITKSIEDLFDKGPIEPVKKILSKISESVGSYAAGNSPNVTLALVSAGAFSATAALPIYFNSLELAYVGGVSLAIGLIPTAVKSAPSPY